MSNLLDLCTSDSTTRLGPCAEVRVGEHVTRYVRRGTGPSVVVVGADAQASAVWSPLVEHLAASHRVFVPEPPPADADVTSWLRGFIEGVGLTAIVLVAGDSASAASLDLAAADDFIVRRLVVLSAVGAQKSVTRADGQAPVDRTLWVLPEWSMAESLQRIESFISA